MEVRVGNTPINGTSPLTVRNKICSWVNNPSGANSPFNVTCKSPMPGQYVSIQLVEKTGYLTLCEVQVFGSTTMSPNTVSMYNVAEGGQAYVTGAHWYDPANAVDGLADNDMYSYPYCASGYGLDPIW